MREVGFDSAFTFIYSPREGTPAARMEDDITEEEKKERLLRLNEVVAELSLASNLRLKDRVVEVLVEGQSKSKPDMLSGRTRTNKLVHFSGSPALYGSFVNVRITGVQTWYLQGELVKEPETAAVS
jgi:tRNA-2-methylthio-N6-dimethylallyladenosine synthase